MSNPKSFLCLLVLDELSIIHGIAPVYDSNKNNVHKIILIKKSKYSFKHFNTFLSYKF